MLEYTGKKHYIRLSVIAVAIFLIGVWLQGILSGEQGRVRKCILSGRNAIEQKDIITCTALVSKRYQDTYGNDRETVLLAAKEIFSYYKDITIHIEHMEIALNDAKDKASVEITALVVCRRQDNTNEKIFEGEKGRFRVSLAKEGNVWLVQEVTFLETLTIMGQTIS